MHILIYTHGLNFVTLPTPLTILFFVGSIYGFFRMVRDIADAFDGRNRRRSVVCVEDVDGDG
jgi:hypothetical protein